MLGAISPFNKAILRKAVCEKTGLDCTKPNEAVIENSISEALANKIDREVIFIKQDDVIEELENVETPTIKDNEIFWKTLLDSDSHVLRWLKEFVQQYLFENNEN